MSGVGETRSALPAVGGAALAVAAAVLFGASTPLIQRAGAGVGPFTTAGLLYAGAALAGVLLRRPLQREAGVRYHDLPRLLAMAGFGALLAPVALAWGLQRTSAAAASLMLAFEVLFTALLAWSVYGESVDRRVGAAMLLLAGGGVVLVFDQGRVHIGNVWGLLAVVAATAAWGVDNILSRKLAERDPGRVVAAKAAFGALASGALAWVAAESPPVLAATLGLLAVGATGYGLSLRLYLLAQRSFGALRTASVFALAPFIGAALAVGLGERPGGVLLIAGGVLMLAGVALHATERHEHEHMHETLEHEHAHRHDDGHHDHAHEPMPAGEHSHWHRHEPMHHAHPHVPDAHHTHRH